PTGRPVVSDSVARFDWTTRTTGSAVKPIAFAVMMALALASPARAAEDEAAVAADSQSAADANSESTLPKVQVSAETQDADDTYAPVRTRSATKTDTLLRDVPQSITVVSERMIQDASMQNMADVVRYVPGVGMAQGEGNRDTPILRGNASTADFFVDGVRDDVEYFRDLYNVERVEALKGPNAMIFGRAGAGGVINRVTRQAGWDDVREVSLQAGSWDNLRTTADFGGALNDKVAVRVTGLYEDSESYRDGFELERYGVNPTLAMRLGENSTLRLGYEYYTYDRIADRGVPSFDGRPVETDESTFFGDPTRSPTDATVNLATAVVDHEFGNGISLRNRTLYGDYDKFYQNVYPGGEATVDENGIMVVPISAYNNAQQRENLFNQTDLVFSLTTGSVEHDLLTGVEIGSQETDNFRNTGFFNDELETVTAPVSSPTISIPVTFRQDEDDNDNHVEANVAAIYVQDQVRVSEHFQAVLGLRYDQFDVNFDNNRTGVRLESDDDLVSPRAGLIYKPAEPVSLYASYSMTYLPRSGAQMTSLTATNEALDPEEYENYEIGAKWDLRPDLSLSAAVYRLDRTNVAIPDPLDPSLSILVDGQKTEGVELGISGQVTEAWSMFGGYAYQDGELTATASTTAVDGATLAQLPEHKISLWNRYQLTPAWGVGLGLMYQSDMYTSTDNTVTLPSFTRVDAALFYSLNDRIRAQLNIENVLDEEYLANAHNNNNISPGSPLAVRMGVTVAF
ncbi:MAG TPA: TonB-dependent siderophore receptor, partial [Vicinamibacterales bacterium]